VLVLPLEAIAERLAARGFQVGRITGLRALDADARTREEMGRVYDVTVLHEGAGRMLTVPALTFRAAMNQGAVGEQRFYSTYFRIDMRRGEAVFEGRGHGHGVGLCQYGARHLARQGRSYAEILAWYYNGHHLVRLW
jgi:stage II sporulation protein D